jgi:hypothetical protein
MSAPLFRVIDTKTGMEADEVEIALHEEWAKGLIYCDMDGWAICQDGETIMLLDECGRHEFPPAGRFKVEWLRDPREPENTEAP